MSFYSSKQGISCHAKKESLIWTIKTHLSEVCQRSSLKILNVDTALEFFHHKLLSSMRTGFPGCVLLENILLAEMIETSKTQPTHKLWWSWPSLYKEICTKNPLFPNECFY